MKKHIDVVLVTYNRVKLLKECIDSLLLQRENISSIFVINNNSTDGTSTFLKQFKDSKIVIVDNLKENIGGAAGFEYGVKRATEKGNGDYVWIMDDDTIPEVNASSALLESAHKLSDHFGFLCSNVRWTDGGATNIPHVSFDWPKKINEGLVKVEAATFVSVLVPKINIFNLGCPLGEMQIWGDDTEYTTRLSQYSDSYFVLNSFVTHKTKYNLMRDTLKNIEPNRIDRFKAMYRNLMYVKRHYAGKKDVLKMSVGNVITGVGALTAKNHKLKRFNAAIVGTWNGFFFNPKVEIPEKNVKGD